MTSMKRFLFLSLAFLTFSNVFAQITVTNERSINSAFQEYSPAFYGKGLVFVAANPAIEKDKKEDTQIGRFTTSIFLAKRSPEGVLQRPLPFAEELTTKFYDGPMSFNAAGDVVFFTRSNLKKGKPKAAKDGKVKLKIYTALLNNGQWTNIIELPFCDGEADYAHPAVSADGRRLFFSSNRSGGQGGMDLYVSMNQNGSWGEPVNLGPKINTAKDEIFPFSHASGALLFSTNGRKAVGGLDIFSTKQTENGWLPPAALPETINSTSDDFGLILNESRTNGYFASNRASGLGDDDIYNVSIPEGLELITTSSAKVEDDLFANTSKTDELAAAEKARQEATRIAEQKRLEELKRIEEQKREDAKLAEQKLVNEIAEKKRQEADLEAQKRVKAEIAEAKAKEAQLAEKRRTEAQKEEQKREEVRLAEEKKKAGKLAEQQKEDAKIAEQKKAKIAADMQKREEARLAEENKEAARLAEQRQKEAKTAELAREQAKTAEQKREEAKLAEARLAEQKREEARLAQAKIEEQKQEEAKRIAAQLEAQKREDARLAEVRREELRLAEAKIVEQKQLEAKLAAQKREEARLTEAKLAAQKREEARIAEAKIAEQKREEARIAETKIAEQKREEVKLAEAKIAEQKREEVKLAEAKMAELKREEARLVEVKIAEQKREDARLVEAKIAEQKQTAAQLAEQKREEARYEEKKRQEEKLAEVKAAQQKREEARIAEAKAEEAKLVEAKLAEAKLAETKIAELKSEEMRMAEAKIAEAKLAEAKIAELKREEKRMAEAKIAEAKLVEAKIAEEKAKNKDSKKRKKEVIVKEVIVPFTPPQPIGQGEVNVSQKLNGQEQDATSAQPSSVVAPIAMQNQKTGQNSANNTISSANEFGETSANTEQNNNNRSENTEGYKYTETSIATFDKNSNIAISQVKVGVFPMKTLKNPVVVTDAAGKLTGIRTDDGTAIPLDELPQQTEITNEKGRVKLPLVIGERYLFTFSKAGYDPKFIIKTILVIDNRVAALLILEKKENAKPSASVVQVKIDNPKPSEQPVVYAENNYKTAANEPQRTVQQDNARPVQPVDYYTNTQQVDTNITLADNFNENITRALGQGRTFELRNIYYGYGDAELSDLTKKELQPLVMMMQQDPEMVIEIAAHTDSRGKAPFNLNLSQLRADNIRTFLAENNIAADRIKTIGYGETRLKNRCADNVECTEQEHQINRRTEIRALKAGVLLSTIAQNDVDMQKMSENTDLSRDNREGVLLADNSTNPAKYLNNSTISQRYLVVVGTYAKPANAEKQRQKVMSSGFLETDIVHFPDNGFYGVCVRHFDTFKEAQSLSNFINAQKEFESFVKELK
jgi:outer membrane protein OmpA-like peptidoglycan-associated protein